MSLPPSRWLAALLAYVAGYIDTVGFLGVFGLFAAHITGNMALLSAALIHNQDGSEAKLLAIPVFMFAVAVIRAVSHAAERRGADWFRPAATVHLALLAAFMLAGIAWPPFESASDWRAVATGLLGVAAMGVQSAMTRIDGLVQTTAMTGNTTQMVIDLVDLASASDFAARAKAVASLRRVAPVVIGFVGGAASGGLGYDRAGFAALALPIALSAALLAGEWREPKLARP